MTTLLPKFDLKYAALALFSAGCLLGGTGHTHAQDQTQGSPGISPLLQNGLNTPADLQSNAPDMSDQGQDTAQGETQSPEEIEEEVRQEAFEAALEGLMPLRPSEIRTLLERFDRTQESVETPIYPDPKPEMEIVTIPLDPGSVPPSVKMAYGHVTTMTIVDSTGSPWPIQDVSWAGDFEIMGGQGTEGDYSHILRITPQSEFASGNMSLKLVGLETPVILILQTSRDMVHYRFDAIIPEMGPLANVPLIEGGLTIKAGDPDIATILRGVTPPNAEQLDVTGVDQRTRAYRYNDLTYVRTPLTLLSPTWSHSVASTDGMRVYALESTPVLLFSDRGRTVRAYLSEQRDIFDEQ